jgi:hypothetical protein
MLLKSPAVMLAVPAVILSSGKGSDGCCTSSDGFWETLYLIHLVDFVLWETVPRSGISLVSYRISSTCYSVFEALKK